ncbi:MAG: hypothetical protein ACLUEV_01045 [Alistipes sp.]|nr:hypothetical protein [Candidatus Alistipes pullistercoris]
MKIEGNSTLKFLTQSAMAQQGEWFYQPHNAITMQNLSDYYKFSGKYLDMINGMEPDANPVIIYYRFKPF